MPRVSIYVPIDLKERMDRVKYFASWAESCRPCLLKELVRAERARDAFLKEERLREVDTIRGEIQDPEPIT